MIRYFTIVCLLFFALASQAQSPSSSGPAPSAATAVPLDGGASLLLASGAAYGLRRLRQLRRRA